MIMRESGVSNNKNFEAVILFMEAAFILYTVTYVVSTTNILVKNFSTVFHL